VELEFVEMPKGHTADKEMVQRITEWKQRFDNAYCQELKEQPGCLDRPLGKTKVQLHAEELRIRRFETNLGNWLADLARETFADKGAQIALLNSGGMRLNQNIPAGSVISRKQISTLFAYPTRLVQIKLTGAQLQQVLSHSVSDWTGNGHWLQVSGLAFRHDPDREKADRLNLVTESGLKPITAEDELNVVVNDFLIDSNGNRDGYIMLSEALLVDPKAQRPDLRDIVIKSLQEAGKQGISPKQDGRICNVMDRQKCMLDQ
jgi:5'-nucleotidase